MSRIIRVSVIILIFVFTSDLSMVNGRRVSNLLMFINNLYKLITNIFPTLSFSVLDIVTI
jgi:hypothetical protein